MPLLNIKNQGIKALAKLFAGISINNVASSRSVPADIHRPVLNDLEEDVRKPALNLKGIRILIIEDEPDIIELYRLIYGWIYCYLYKEESGCICKALLSADPPQAQNVLDAIQEFKPHLITTGILQPGMNGFEIIQALKNQIPDCPPIIVISATGWDKRHVRKAYALGAEDVIAKGEDFKTGDLLERVHRVLKRHGSV
jgi:DNA-binding response OmpR family regulator